MRVGGLPSGVLTLSVPEVNVAGIKVPFARASSAWVSRIDVCPPSSLPRNFMTIKDPVPFFGSAGYSWVMAKRSVPTSLSAWFRTTKPGSRSRPRETCIPSKLGSLSTISTMSGSKETATSKALSPSTPTASTAMSTVPPGAAEALIG